MLEQSLVVKLRALAPASRAKFCKGAQGCDLPETSQKKTQLCWNLASHFQDLQYGFRGGGWPSFAGGG